MNEVLEGILPNDGVQLCWRLETRDEGCDRGALSSQGGVQADGVPAGGASVVAREEKVAANLTTALTFLRGCALLAVFDEIGERVEATRRGNITLNLAVEGG
jgi:hypothetical protein